MAKPHALLRRPWEMGQIIYRGALSFQSSKELTPMDGSFLAERYFDITVCAQMKDYEQQWYVWKGFALAWFIWEQGQHPFRGWKEFKELLLLRFRSSQEGTLQEQLMSLLQTSLYMIIADSLRCCLHLFVGYHLRYLKLLSLMACDRIFRQNFGS